MTVFLMAIFFGLLKLALLSLPYLLMPIKAGPCF